MKNEIVEYYDDLAKHYDENRFANTYGRYIHQQEDKVVSALLKESQEKYNLDIACGTGRFLKYADSGIDISLNMINEAKLKFPHKNLSVDNAWSTSFIRNTFQHVTAFHLMMHLDIPKIQKILIEVYRITKKDGLFIFDIPSLKRRNLTRYNEASWHGSNSLSKNDLLNLIGPDWTLVNYYGIAFFPIHRIPKFIRKYFIGIDNRFCNSFLKEYASHLIFVLKRND